MRRAWNLCLLSVLCLTPATAGTGIPLHFEPSTTAGAFVSKLPGHSVWATPQGLTVRTKAGDQVRLHWLTKTPGALSGGQRLGSRSHYLHAGQQRRNVPHFAELVHSKAFPGVDVRYYGNHGRLELDFIVAPGASVAEIAFEVHGAEPTVDDATGELILATATDELRALAPLVYQPRDDSRLSVAGRYEVSGGVVRFRVGEYDPSLPLVIDPVLEYATYLAGEDDDGAFAIAVGPDGMAYVAGFAEFAEDGPSAQFPTTPGAFDTDHSGEAGSNNVEYDAFILKLNEDASELIWSTFLGGEAEDVARGIAVGQDLAPVVVGSTRSQLFATTSGAFDRTRGGAQDAFIAKLSADGSELLWSTYLGGSGSEVAYAVALDGEGAPVVAGESRSTDFPTAPGAQQATSRGGMEAFVVRLATDGSALEASTLLGGSGDDAALGVAVGTDSSVFITGSTASPNFPTTTAAFQPGPGGGAGDQDAFVAKLPAALDALDYSTYFGGDSPDWANAVAVDPAGAAHVTGYTESASLPIGPDAFDASYNGNGDAFLATLSADGATATCTFLGGDGRDEGLAIALGAAGERFVAGQSASSDLPVGADAIQETLLGATGDGFLTQLSAEGDLLDGTYYGSSNEDSVQGVAIDAAGAAFIAGMSQSEPLPRRPLRTTPGAFRTGPNDDPDAFAAKLVFAAPTPAFSSVSAASFAAAEAVAPGSLVSGFGDGLATELAVATELPLPTTLAGVRVIVTDSAGTESAAELVFVSAGQINYVVPDALSAGEAEVRVERDGETVAVGALRLAQSAPSLFTANANGSGVAAASVVQASPDGVQISFFAFTDDAPGARQPLPIDLGPEGTVTVLVVFGTGFRGASSVTATLGGRPLNVLFAGEQPQFRGLDQANLELDRSLIGLGAADLVLTADGATANIVQIAIR